MRIFFVLAIFLIGCATDLWQVQEKSHWCWAAVMSGISANYGNKIPQCKIVGEFLKRDCCKLYDDSCDITMTITDFPSAVNNILGINYDIPDHIPSIISLADEINNDKLFVANFELNDDAGNKYWHATLIYKIDIKNNLVYVMDPGSYYVVSNPLRLDYDYVSSKYIFGFYVYK